MKNFTFSNYCTPAYLNVALGLAIITGTFLAGLRPEMIAAEALFIGIWALGLKWLCSKGYKIISWSLAVVPVILALYMVIIVKNGVATKEGQTNQSEPPGDKPVPKSMYEIVKAATEPVSVAATELAAATVRGVNDVRGAASELAAAIYKPLPK